MNAEGTVADVQPDEQVKVIQAITSVIQALDPTQAIDPVYVSCFYLFEKGLMIRES